MDFIKREDAFASSITALATGITRKKELVVGLAEKSQSG
jgi:hypothetical protein